MSTSQTRRRRESARASRATRRERLTGTLGASYVVSGERYVLLRVSARLVVLVSTTRPAAALVFEGRVPNPAYWRNYQ